MTELKEVLIHTDGACKGNPGPGGWGAVLQHLDVVKEVSGGEAHTTNNRMEMTAVIRGLELLKEPCKVTVVSDSKYIIDNIHGVPVWRSRGWKTTAKKPVKNKDLWERLDELCGIHRVTFQWVKGHNGHEGNERADFLASSAAEEASN